MDDKSAALSSAAKAVTMAPDGKSDVVDVMAPSTGKPEPTPATDPWDALHIGTHVLGKYWEQDGAPIGWWVGVITAINKNDFMIRWPDEPLKPALKIERKHVALLHPSFDVAREWDRRR